jgi:hypothetical protein
MTTEADGMTVGVCFDRFLFIKLMTGNTFLVLMLFMRKLNFEFPDVLFPGPAAICDVTETRKQKAHRISRRHVDVAV